MCSECVAKRVKIAFEISDRPRFFVYWFTVKASATVGMLSKMRALVTATATGSDALRVNFVEADSVSIGAADPAWSQIGQMAR